MRVHYRLEGDGPALLLLHGTGSSLDIFDELVSRLTARFEVLRLDLPGFGLTGPRPDRDYSVRAYTSLVRRFAGQLVDRPFVVAGHSFGGQLALNFALDYPDAIDGLVLMNATGYPEKSLPLAMRMARHPVTRPVVRRFGSRAAVARNLASIVGPGSDAVDDVMIDRVHGLLSRPGNRSAFVDVVNTDQIDRSAAFHDVRTPTLVLRSDLVEGQHFVADIPNSREIGLNGVGHLMPAEAPSAVADAIIAFTQSSQTVLA